MEKVGLSVVEGLTCAMGLQVWSNGKLKKVRGKPTINMEEGNNSSSLSMSLLVTLPLESTVSPLLPRAVISNHDDTDNDDNQNQDDHNEPLEEIMFSAFSFEDYAWRVYHERQRIRLYCRGKENGVNILKSIDEGPYRMGTVREILAESIEGAPQFGPERPRLFSDLTSEEKDRHLGQCQDAPRMVRIDQRGPGFTVMTMSRLQLNSKFVNNMLPEWGRFVTAVKLNRGLRDSNYDQLYAYSKQQETHEKENKMMLERFSQPTVDPLALLSNRRPNRGQGMNLRGGSAAGHGGAPNRVGNVNPGQAGPGQARPVKCYNCNGAGHIAQNCTQPKRPQNSEYYKDKMLLMQAQKNGVALDAEQLLFLADPVTDEAGPSYDSDVLSEVQDHDQYQDAACAHHEEHVMHDNVQLDHVVDSHADYTTDSNMIPYDQYVKDNEVPVVHSDVSSVPNDAFMMIYDEMCEPHDQSVSYPSQVTAIKNSLTAALATFKEQVELPKPHYNELNKVAIGYKNPLCLTRAKLVQPALYNGHEIIKDNHTPARVYNVEDTIEIAEITRKKMIAKMNDPECVTRKNFLATFTPQKQLTPEQIFWSNDLMKLKSEALKERTKVSRPIKALTVYHPNTPATLVPRVLPTKSQVKIVIFTLVQLFSEFDKTCKMRITPIGLTEGEMGFEQTKACYLNEVIPFFKTLKDNVKGIQKALTKEIKEMKDVFEELEAEARCLELEVGLANLRDKHNHDNQKELINYFFKLEVNHLNLQLKYQNLKDSIGNNSPTPDKDTSDFDSVFVIDKMQASLQGKDNVIRQLRKQLSQFQLTRSNTDRTLQVQTADSQITKLTEQVTDLQAQNSLFRAENDKIKQHYKELDAHLDYLRHLKKSVETIRDIVEDAMVVRPLDRSLVSACRYTKHSQELLEYAIGTCPQGSQQRAKQLVHIIIKRHLSVACS
nr:hypothetical protein [Tanacetum cinerariifolium]